MTEKYALLDCGEERKLEQFGKIVLDRPCPQAIFLKKNPALWKLADARLVREGKESEWEIKNRIPERWQVELAGVICVLRLTDFGHVGLFPEHADFWPWLKNESRGLKILNLFAYSGGATIALALGGAKVCHLDAAKGMVEWARENAKANRLDDQAVRWIVDDALKFLQREERRGLRYDGIILDPPSFGRGPKGEVFKIEEKIHPLLKSCQAVLSEKAKFILLTSHTPGWTPKVLDELFKDYFKGFHIEASEMLIAGRLPSGSFVLGKR